MGVIELVRGGKDSGLSIGGVKVPMEGMTDITCCVRPDSLTEVTITMVVSEFKVTDSYT